MQSIKTIVDALSILVKHMDEEYITVVVLTGLDSKEYKTVIEVIRSMTLRYPSMNFTKNLSTMDSH